MLVQPTTYTKLFIMNNIMYNHYHKYQHFFIVMMYMLPSEWQRLNKHMHMHPCSLCVSLNLSDIRQIYHGESGQPFSK